MGTRPLCGEKLPISLFRIIRFRREQDIQKRLNASLPLRLVFRAEMIHLQRRPAVDAPLQVHSDSLALTIHIRESFGIPGHDATERYKAIRRFKRTHLSRALEHFDKLHTDDLSAVANLSFAHDGNRFHRLTTTRPSLIATLLAVLRKPGTHIGPL